MKKYFLQLRLVLLIVVLSIPLIIPFLHSGYFPTHDGEWAVVRLSDMYREVRDGQIPARFSGNLNFSYGYPLFNFAYPLPYYLGLIFFLLHFGLVNSIKLLFVLTVPFSGIAMYFACSRLSRSKLSAVVGALLYMYLPYRMVDLYVRGSLGESIASVLFPLIVLAMLQLKEKTSYFGMLLLSMSFAAIILAHNIMATYSIVMIGLFMVWMLLQKNRRVIPIIISLVIGLGLSAFFWLPALIEKHLILLSHIPIADRDLYYIPLAKFIYSSFGYGTPTEANPFTYQLGIFHLVLFLIVVGGIVYAYRKKKKLSSEVVVFATVLLIYFLLLFPFTATIWKYTPLLKEINYPWTLLLPIGFLVSLLIGSYKATNRVFQVVILILLAGNCLLVTSFAHPKEYVDRGDSFYLTNDATTTSSNELMPLTVKSMPSSRPSQKVEIKQGKGSVQLGGNKSQKVSFVANLESDISIIRLNTIYFPGWQWYESGKEIPIFYNNPAGVMEAVLSKGQHQITARFQDTPDRTVANILSVFSLLGLVLLGVVTRSKKYSL